MLGRLQSGVLDLTEIHRFSIEPIRECAALRWDLPQLWNAMQDALVRAASEGSALASIGVDTWGCDYGDTGSAVAAVAASRTRAYLSCGTWSLLGVEVPE